IVAQENSEFDKLEKIRLNAIACGIKNVRYIEKNELKSMEPAIRSERTLLIPDTGIVDTHLLMKFLHDYARSKDIDFVFGTDVTDIKRSDGEYLITVKEPNGESFSFCSTWVINAAGLYSDAIAKMPGLDVEEYGYKLHFSKGQYFRIQKPGKFNITRLVYPPPSDIDLGIHLTPDLAGGLRLGPDSEYVGNIEYSVDPNRTETFFSSARRFLPSLDISDITPESSGIRPKLQTETGPFRDFVISEESEKGFPHMINLIGIESPGLTASLAIAKKIERLIK
ncbi:MAG TPA: FAD-dependent oxidoreductase, partial [Candidatus Omnitrophota bacterium]|nr:FAD-dependent oxidoreductase [Candidatus Omnitrophota bacterium]